MARDLVPLLGPYGVARVSDVPGLVDRHTLGRWVVAGRLLRPHRGVVALPDAWDDWRTRALVGVLATGGTLSHTTTLAVWRVVEGHGPVHVSVPAGRRALDNSGLVVHRARDLVMDQLGPFPVTLLPRSLADSWGAAHGHDGHRRVVARVRGAVIETLRDRRVTVAQLRMETVRRPAPAGTPRGNALIGPVEQGCRSELEMWGVREVLGPRACPGSCSSTPSSCPSARCTWTPPFPS